MSSIYNNSFEKTQEAYDNYINQCGLRKKELDSFKDRLDNLPESERMAIYLWINSRKDPVSLLLENHAAITSHDSVMFEDIKQYVANFVKLKLKESDIFSEKKLGKILDIARLFISSNIDISVALEIFNKCQNYFSPSKQ